MMVPDDQTYLEQCAAGKMFPDHDRLESILGHKGAMDFLREHRLYEAPDLSEEELSEYMFGSKSNEFGSYPDVEAELEAEKRFDEVLRDFMEQMVRPK